MQQKQIKITLDSDLVKTNYSYSIVISAQVFKYGSNYLWIECANKGQNGECAAKASGSCSLDGSSVDGATARGACLRRFCILM